MATTGNSVPMCGEVSLSTLVSAYGQGTRLSCRIPKNIYGHSEVDPVSNRVKITVHFGLFAHESLKFRI